MDARLCQMVFSAPTKVFLLLIQIWFDFFLILKIASYVFFNTPLKYVKIHVKMLKDLQIFTHVQLKIRKNPF